ncbi:MAG: 4-hydroxy-tetrahydrodipicolinate synthase [Kiritimatiellae bacterium]|nr:4-hydroxy-tetrahydrodipicolinate synthase [Kiritimatiellia bacterium]
MFTGVYTALVTPFNTAGNVDYDTLQQLVESQIAGHVDGLVPVGTTGESPTLEFDEHKKVIERVVEFSKGHLKIIAGTGGNSTAEAVELTQHAKEVGAHGTLQITPYYNKPSREGLIQHFRTVAEIGLPVVLYNIPGRTGRELSLDLVVELAQDPNIVAIKEAAGDVDRVSQYVQACDLTVLSGDDALTLPMMVVGSVGVISVVSNIAPQEVTDMVHHALKGRWEQAQRSHAQLYRLFTDLFIETNPVPVKAALAMVGKIEEIYRLPLCEMGREKKAVLKEAITDFGIKGIS